MLEKLQKEFIEARKLRDSVKSNLLGTVLSEITKIEKHPQRVGKPITVDDVIKVLKSFEVSTNEVLKLVPGEQKATRELEILKGYLPSSLTEEQLISAIREIVDSGEMTIGSVIGSLKQKFPGQYDGKRASDIIKNLLGQK